MRMLCLIGCAILLVGCEAATRDKKLGAGVAVATGLTGAAIYRATTGGCWAQCTHGKICDRKSGTCVDAVRDPHAAGAKASSTTGAASADSHWWEDESPCPEGAALDRQSFEEDGRVMSCKTADGVENGRATFFFTNGRKQMEGSYCAGVPCRVWTNWDEDGAVNRVEEIGEPPAD